MQMNNTVYPAVEEDMVGTRYFNYGRLGNMYAREAGSWNQIVLSGNSND